MNTDNMIFGCVQIEKSEKKFTIENKDMLLVFS